MRKKLFVVLSAALLGLTATGAAHAQSDSPGTIVDVASANPDFSTLVTAVKAAGLVETLSGKGPFTVFAPTNAAFAALPAGTLDALLKDPKGALTDILKLHVIAGAVDSKAATAAAGTNVDSLGGPIAVELKGDKLLVGGATVIKADIKASNGIIHVIDAVITKPAAAATATAETTVAEAAAPETTVAESTATPTKVNTGDDGLAAQSSRSTTLFVLLAIAAFVGLGTSSVALVRGRRSR